MRGWGWGLSVRGVHVPKCTQESHVWEWGGVGRVEGIWD